MEAIFGQNILLKLLFLPVIIFIRLIVAEIEGFALSISCCKVFLTSKSFKKSDRKKNTIVDEKVRMDN